MPDDKESLLKIVNASGFLFQLSVEQHIKHLYRPHFSNWSVLSREHRWIDPFISKESFVDLILQSHAGRMIIECKRIRGGEWIFLIANSATDMYRARLLWTFQRENHKPYSDWDEFKFTYSSPESAFCVIRGKGEGDTPMLERLSGLVLRSTEIFAEQELRIGPDREYGPARIYIPTIITNAELKICRFDPDAIDIKTGTLPDAEFESVPVVRFRKSLSSTFHSNYEHSSINESYEMQQRTVFIINANSLGSVLPNSEIKPFSSDGYPWDQKIMDD